ncbi:hypothetical protein DRQ53_15080 [bacterium]|nr:MAG: hypothetical protein DRQ53_15080 [bacterium]
MNFIHSACLLYSCTAAVSCGRTSNVKLWDFGDHPVGAVLMHRFRFKNTTNTTVRIVDLRESCGCQRTEISYRGRNAKISSSEGAWIDLRAGESAWVNVSANVKSLGRLTIEVRVDTIPAQNGATYRCQANGVEGATVNPRVIRLGEIANHSRHSLRWVVKSELGEAVSGVPILPKVALSDGWIISRLSAQEWEVARDVAVEGRLGADWAIGTKISFSSFSLDLAAIGMIRDVMTITPGPIVFLPGDTSAASVMFSRTDGGQLSIEKTRLLQSNGAAASVRITHDEHTLFIQQIGTDAGGARTGVLSGRVAVAFHQEDLEGRVIQFFGTCVSPSQRLMRAKSKK